MQNNWLKTRLIRDKAMEALTAHLPLSVQWESADGPLADTPEGFLVFPNQRIYTTVKSECRMHHLSELWATKEKSQGTGFLLIANTISEPVKKQLKKLGINYLDTAGNASIFYPPAIAIVIQGAKKQAILQPDKAFTKTGLALVFAYLTQDGLMQQNYRQIAAMLQISIDTIAKTNASLKMQHFVRQLTPTNMVLTDKKRLFQKWSDVYATRIKPKLFYEKFSFLTPAAERDWKSLKLSTQSCWGGEAAADLLTTHLRPALFTLYSTESKADLMRQYRFKPNPNGNIEVYLPFTDWNLMAEKGMTHVLLTYADLLNSGDPRNFEVAEQIYETYAQKFF
ncbi:MAG: hypothetical protein RL329_3286 [Bacteroidota bacterium]